MRFCISLVLVLLVTAACGGETKHLPSSNPPEYDPKNVYTTPPALPNTAAVVQPVVPPPSSQAKSPTMDPVALRNALETADRTRAILERVESSDTNVQLHAILEALMKGEQAPPELRPTFMESFGPRKAQIHQAFNKQYKQLQQALDEERKFPAMQLPLIKSSGFEPFAPYRVDMRRRQVVGKPWIHLVGVEMLPRGTTVSFEPDCCGRWKIITIPESAFEGKGFNLEIKSAGRYEADKDHFSIDSEALTTTIKVVVGDKATINVKILKKNRAVVNRCPSASGVVPGEASVYEEMGYHVSTATAINRAGIFVLDQAKTDAHTDEEGLVQEITMDITAEDLDGETGQVLRRASGKAVKKRDMPVVCDGCTTRVADAAKKLGRMASWNYYNAEQLWKKPVYSADACVKIHFTPATKIVSLSPGASTKVKAELRTVGGDQATEGRLFELQELHDGKVTPQDEKTSPQSPAVFTFTAPNSRWSKSALPGFRVFNSSSRAGRAWPKEWEVAPSAYVLEFSSRIVSTGKVDPGQSQASAVIRLEAAGEERPEGDLTYIGQGMISYQTAPLPNWKACRPLIQGKGLVPMRIYRAFIRENLPGSVQVELLYGILGLSQETTTGWAYRKDFKCVPNPPEFHPFWSSMYLSGRAEAGASAETMFTLKNWTYVGRDGVVATKTLRSTCGGECTEEVATFTLKEADGSPEGLSPQ